MAERLNLQDLAQRSAITPRRGRADVFVRPVDLRPARRPALSFEPLIAGLRDLNEAKDALKELQAAESANLLVADEDALDALDKEIREKTAGVEDDVERSDIAQKIWFRHIEENGLPRASHPRTLKHVRQISATRMGQQFSVEANAFLQEFTSESSLAQERTVEEGMEKLREIRQKYQDSSLIQGSVFAERSFQETSDKVMADAESMIGARLQEQKDKILSQENQHYFTAGGDGQLMGFGDLSDGFEDDFQKEAHQNRLFEVGKQSPQLPGEYAKAFRRWAGARLSDPSEDDLEDVKMSLAEVRELVFERRDGSTLPLDEIADEFEGTSAQALLAHVEGLLDRAEQDLDDSTQERVDALGDAERIGKGLILRTINTQGGSEAWLDPETREARVAEIMADPAILAAYSDVPGGPAAELEGFLLDFFRKAALEETGQGEASVNHSAAKQIRQVASTRSVAAAEALLEAQSGDISHNLYVELQDELNLSKRIEGFVGSSKFQGTEIHARLAEGQEEIDVLSPALRQELGELSRGTVETLRGVLLENLREEPQLTDEKLSARSLEIIEEKARNFGIAYERRREAVFKEVSDWQDRQLLRGTFSLQDLRDHVESGTALFRSNHTDLKAARELLAQQEMEVAEARGITEQDVESHLNGILRAAVTKAELEGMETDEIEAGVAAIREKAAAGLRDIFADTEALGAEERGKARQERTAALKETLFEDTALESYVPAEFVPERPQSILETTVESLEGGQSSLDLLPRDTLEDVDADLISSYKEIPAGRTRPHQLYKHQSDLAQRVFLLPREERAKRFIAAKSAMYLHWNTIQEGRVTARADILRLDVSHYSPISDLDKWGPVTSVLSAHIAEIPENLGGTDNPNPAVKRAAIQQIYKTFEEDLKEVAGIRPPTTVGSALEDLFLGGEFRKTKDLTPEQDQQIIETLNNSKTGKVLKSLGFSFNLANRHIVLEESYDLDVSEMDPALVPAAHTQAELNSYTPAVVRTMLRDYYKQDPTDEDIARWFRAQQTYINN